MRREIILSSALLAGAAFTGRAAAKAKPAPQAKPNFIVVLLDDSGFADLGCYGGEIPTPNIDALAQKGVRMSQMYNCARSCPTRASILTGLYPQQAGVGFMVGGPPRGDRKASAAYQGYLNDNCVTFAQVMHDNGYFTAMTGKWHVGQQNGVAPWNRGFDRSMNSPGGGFYYGSSEKAEVYLNGEKLANDDPRLPQKWYATDLWTQYGIKFVNEAIDKKQPFVLYLAYNAPHFPLQAPEEDIASFKGQFSQGWDEMRRQVYQRQLDMNLLGKVYPLTKRNPLIPMWNTVDAAQKAQSELIMEIYAAALSHVDKCVGELVADLKSKGAFDNTVIMVLSDNGGNAEGKTVFGTFEGEFPGGPGSEIYLGQAWAETCNTPFYLYKHHVHEGGISTPLVVSYPAGIPAKLNGSTVSRPGHVIDIMATMVAMSGATYPKSYKGNSIIPMQGINLMPIWLGENPVRTQPIFWEHEDNLALRDGKWKIVKERGEDNYQLYDMEADRTEMNDLAQKEPGKLAEMRSKLDEMFKKVGAEHLNFGKSPRWFVPINEY